MRFHLGYVFLFLSFIFSFQQAWAIPCQVGQLPYDTVQSAIDDENCTEISVPAGVFYENLSISRAVEIKGAGIGQTIFSGGGNGRVVEISSYSFAAISQSVVMSKLTIQDGIDEEQGAGIYCHESGLLQLKLVLNKVQIQHNQIQEGGLGSGIYSYKCSVVIKNSWVQNNILYDFFNSGTASGAGIYIEEADFFSVNTHYLNNETSLTRTAQGGAITLISMNLVKIKKSHFSQNESTVGGGIFLSEAQDLEISKSSFETNHADENAGAFWLDIADTQMQARLIGNTFTTNTANGKGGALILRAGGNAVLDLRSNYFLENSSLVEGGALCILDNVGFVGDLQIDSQGNIFEGNLASEGAAIFSSSIRTLFFDQGSQFENNSARTRGGAFSVSNMPTLEIRHARFENNRAGYGGAFYSFSTDIHFSETTFLQNNAETHGGSIYLSGESHADFIASHWLENSTDYEDGGAIFIIGSVSARFIANEFSNNNAAANGGAIHFASSGQNFEIRESTFNENHSGAHGGDIFVSSAASVDIFHSHFEGGSAGQAGGAIYAAGLAHLNLANSQILRCDATESGALRFLNVELGTVTDTRIDRNFQTEGAIVDLSYGNYVFHRSSVTRNVGEQGVGGIQAGESTTLALNNTTLSTNSGTSGGGLLVLGDAGVEINHVTIVRNSSSQGISGVRNLSVNPVVVRNSVVAENDGGSCSESVIQEGDFSSVSDDGTCVDANFTQGFAWFDAEPHISDLTMFANGTEGHLPLVTPMKSLLIDNADFLIDDAQNEVTRPQDFQCDQDENPDIGAVELLSSC